MVKSKTVAIFVFVAGVAAAVMTFRHPFLRAVVSGPRKPFAATVVVRFYDGSGKLGRTDVWLEATRADGSTVHRTQTVNDRPDGYKLLTDLSRSVRLTIDPLTESVTTYRLGAHEVADLTDPGFACRNVPADSDEQGTLLGVEVAHRRQHLAAGPREFEEERWDAPTLGCFPMKRSYDSFESGQKIGHTTEEVVSITLGDPAASLFEVPTNYTERRPSEVERLRAEKLGQECGPCMDASSELLDSVYEKSQHPR